LEFANAPEMPLTIIAFRTPGTENGEKSRFSCGQGYTEGRFAVKGRHTP
jgi:hypothetical protein